MNKIVKNHSRLSNKWYLEAKEDWSYSLLSFLNGSVGYLFIVREFNKTHINKVYETLGTMFNLADYGRMMIITAFVLFALPFIKRKTIAKYLVASIASFASGLLFFLYAIITQSIGASPTTPTVLITISLFSFFHTLIEGIKVYQIWNQENTS